MKNVAIAFLLALTACAGAPDDSASAAAANLTAAEAPLVITLVAGKDEVVATTEVPAFIQLTAGQVVRIVNRVGVDLTLSSFDSGNGTSWGGATLPAGHTADFLPVGPPTVDLGIAATAPNLRISFWHGVHVEGDSRPPAVRFLDEATGAPLAR